MDRFPSTSWDLLATATRRDDHSAMARSEFADRYYAAVHAYIAAIARQTPMADPDDLTQRFFEMVVLSGRLLTRADPQKGNFRPYLKQAIRNFLVDEHRRRARSVNPEVRPDTLDGGWNTIVTGSTPGPDEELLRAWGRSLVSMAIKRLEALCEQKNQRQHFELFARRYLADSDRTPTWRDVGEAFGLDEKIARSRTETAVRHFRALLRELVASDIGTAEEIDKELQTVMSVL